MWTSSLIAETNGQSWMAGVRLWRNSSRGSVATMRRSLSSAMRSATINALCISCVTTSEVTDSSRWIDRISSLMRRVLMGSRPVVGSSYSSTSGSAAMARAMATRLRIPPESSAGR